MIIDFTVTPLLQSFKNLARFGNSGKNEHICKGNICKKKECRHWVLRDDIFCCLQKNIMTLWFNDRLYKCTRQCSAGRFFGKTFIQEATSCCHVFKTTFIYCKKSFLQDANFLKVQHLVKVGNEHCGHRHMDQFFGIEMSYIIHFYITLDTIVT